MSRKYRVAFMLELDWLYRRHTDVFNGAMRFADELGWDCVVDEYLDDSLPSRRSKNMRLDYDGIIARATPQLAERARICGIPVVNVWHNSPATELPCVFADFSKVGQLAAEHLVMRGFRRFASISARKDSSHKALLEGFHQKVREEGFSCKDVHGPTEPPATLRNWREFQNTLDRWIGESEPPFGVFVAYNDASSRHVTTACRRHGLRVPDDVAIIAGVNEPAVCLRPPPSLTSIQVGYEQIGYEAARLLGDLMNGSSPPGKPVYHPVTSIVARQSTDFFAVEDELVAAALRFIIDHLDELIGVADVASAVHASRRTLERRFEKSTGRQIFAEIRRLRIEKAKRLLVDSNDPVKEIAHEAGFRSSTHLCQVFQRFVGVSPQQFRKSGI